MAKTTAERQRDYRNNKIISGLKEVRGIWLPPEQHASCRMHCKMTRFSTGLQIRKSKG